MSREYSTSTISGLLHGEIAVPLGNGDFVPLEVPSWAAIRSSIEHRGDVEQPAFHEVMDLERALEQLAQRHPQAAAIAILRMWGFEHEEFRATIPEANWRKLARKGAAWMAAYLSGDDCEIAYKGAR
jgi:hypothetical protein